MESGEMLWNEEVGGAFRFKSTHRAPNTQELNVCTETNVARVDEGERARSQASRPRRGWSACVCAQIHPLLVHLLLKLQLIQNLWNSLELNRI